MKRKELVTAILVASGISLQGCGGGGGGGGSTGTLDDGGAGGGGSATTGVISTGTVDGFGSIFVNGIKFETGSADVMIDGIRRGEDALGLGMVVTVEGTVNSDGVTGTATSVTFEDEVEGPISAIAPGADNDTLLLTVLGVPIIAERTSTVFDDVSFDTLAIDDVIEVSGFYDEDLKLRATRIEKKSVFVAGSTVVELKGTVANLSGTTFTLGDITVDFSGADLSDVSGGALSDGMGVEVHGTLLDGAITATRVEEEDDVSDRFNDADEVSVQGTITDFAGVDNFRVAGVLVDASGARFEPADLVLANGLVVEVEGDWDGTTLTAREVEARRGRVEIEAAVAGVDTTAGTITLALFPGAVTVAVNERTMLDDDTGAEEVLALAEISAGDFLEVEAIMVDGGLVATRIDRDDRDDDVIQGPVQAFNPGVDITVLGITYSVAGAEFEDRGDNTLSADAFFARLALGDLLKIKDELPTDGVADEVEFESEGALDGADDFDDDSEDDESEDDESEDDSDDDSDDESEDEDDESEDEEEDEEEDDADDSAT